MRAGWTTITATVSSPTSSASASCDVYVHLADGVYIIENAASGLCLNSNTPSAQNTTAYMTYLDDSDTLQPKQAWKITYTTTGFYVIRPLEMLDSLLSVDSSGNVVIKPYAQSSTVQILNKWEIGYNNLGYYFHYKGLSTKTLKPTNTATNNSGLQLATHAYQAAMHWHFTPVEGVLLRYTDTGVAMTEEDTICLDVRQSHSISSQGLTVEYYGQPTSVLWHSSNNAITVSSTGKATVNTFGSSTISVEAIIGGKSYFKDYCIAASAKCVFYGIPDNRSEDAHDHITALRTIESTLRNLGWGSITVRDTSVSTSTCLQALKSTNIFISRSHGYFYMGTSSVGTTGIILDNATNVGFYSHSHSGIATGSYVIQSTDDFSNLDLVIFVGCYTGNGGENGNNLPTMMVARGARVAIGFQMTLPCEKAELWTELFIEQLLNGHSIKAAIANVAKVTSLQTYFDVTFGCDKPLLCFLPENIVVCGDENLILFPTES